ncbi:MAG: efflux RND transporter periplasmic adaptor subunit [Bacteroidaceae bacterium]|nr:efflux RND transporter periplasmic adaptor subunit [Bacteroidaceae bacterium]
MKLQSAFLIAGVALLAAGCKPKVKYSNQSVQVERTDITTAITATGTIEPVTSVDVGTQVSGIVSKLYVDYNSVVKAGQVIAELDRTNLMSELSSTQANLRSATSELDYQKTNYERFKNLYDKGLISANEYEQARLSYTKAQQTVNQQREMVKKAQTNLGYATITSPIDGVVLSKEVEEGQTVASSFNTPTLFKIAKDLTDMRVIADVDEADIGEVKEGQRVSFTVDAFPDDVFEGTVTQVRQQATTESNVVTYEVVIAAPNEDLKLKPGLTANVSIFTLEVKDVLAVSNKALRFRPNEELLNEGEAIEDCEGRDKVWVKQGTTYKAVAIQKGVTNGTMTQITAGATEGMEVVTEINNPLDVPQEKAQNPFMPNHGGKKNDKNAQKN